MFNADLALANDAGAKRSKKRVDSQKNIEDEQDQAGFHFIAFVPIQGCVWKLDGLERQPMNLGVYVM
jgi:ubiquitin carboxyl-terminal hydrolase L5